MVAAGFVRQGRTMSHRACDGVTVVRCKEVLDQLSEYVDEEARAELCRAIEAHLARCRGCKIEVDSVKKTILLYHEYDSSVMPVRVGAALESVMAREYQRPQPESPKD